jgi:hypothetical protein
MAEQWITSVSVSKTGLFWEPAELPASDNKNNKNNKNNKKKNPDTHLIIGAWVSPTVGLPVFWEQTNTLPCWKSKYDSLCTQTVVSHYSDWATLPATLYIVRSQNW